MSREGSSEASIEELLRRGRSGDQGALAALFERCRPAIERWAARRFSRIHPGGARPSDIAQEAALHAYDRFVTFSGSTEKEWMAWLLSVFRTQAVQIVRRARRQKRESPPTVDLDDQDAMAALTPLVSPSHAAAIGEEWRRLFTLIYELPEDQSKAIWLCHLKETPIAEVARNLNRTEAAVGGLLQRGLKTLRGRMVTDSAGLAESDAEPSEDAAGRSDAVNALVIYLRRRDAREKVDAAAFIAAHPGCADELRDMLDWIARIEAIRPAGDKT